MNRFRAPPAVARLFYATLEAIRRWQHSPDGAFDEGAAVVLLVEYFRCVYETEARVLMGHHRVFERDGFQCAFPGCDARRLEAHHLRYRSQGGSDDLSNLLSLCPAHHRAGEHGGRVHIEGRAPEELEFRFSGEVWAQDRRRIH